MFNTLSETQPQTNVGVTDQVEQRPPGPILILGIGNPWRGDDRAGACVVQTLERRVLPNVLLELRRTADLELLELWGDFEVVILVDAVMSGAPPGTVHRIDVKEGPLPAALTGHSTHGFGVANVVELARALNRLPKQLIIYGVEADTFDEDRTLSPEIQLGVEQCVKRIIDEWFP